MPVIPTTIELDVGGFPGIYLTTRGNFTDGVIPIPYLELLEGYAERGAHDDHEATRTCIVQWDLRWQFIKDMLGSAQYTVGSSFGGVTTNLHRTVPEAHPEYPFLYASRWEMIEGLGSTPVDTTNLAKSLTSQVPFGTLGVNLHPFTHGIHFNLAKIALHYTPFTYEVFGDNDPQSSTGELGRYVTRTIQAGGENLTLPGKALYFATSVAADQTKNPINESNAIITIATARPTYKWHMVPKVNWQHLLAGVGKINSTGFDAMFGNYPSGTLLLEAFEVSDPYRSPAQDRVYDVTFHFAWKPEGWNYFYRVNPPAGSPNTPLSSMLPSVNTTAGQPGFYLVTVDGSPGGATIFKSRDHNELFRIP